MRMNARNFFRDIESAINHHDEIFEAGEIGVDSGQVMVVDPCYLASWKDGEFPILPIKDEEYLDKEVLVKFPIQNQYDHACRVTLSKGAGPVDWDGGNAVASRTAYGDGGYKVYAIREKSGRIRGLFVDLEGLDIDP